MKMLTDYDAYDNCYHFIGATKYRQKLFDNESMRKRLEQIIADVLDSRNIRLIACAVAYDHIHVLVQTDQDLHKVGNLLFGSVSRAMRQEYPVLRERSPKALWGGTSCTAIADKEHLDNVIAYIAKHQVDNSKDGR